jgi:ATP-dependent Clp protease ATP-binding subunit ClpC
MFERFTDRARKVMMLAKLESERFNSEWIDAEHILLGIIKEGSGVGANVLKNLDVDLKKLCLEIEELLNKEHSGKATIKGVISLAIEKVTKGRLPHSQRAKDVIAFAIEEARLLNHNYVGTEHMLLGLMHVNESIAAQALAKKGVTIKNVRVEVLNMLSPGQKKKDTDAE